MSEMMYMKEQYIGNPSLNPSALSNNDQLVDSAFDGKNEEVDVRSKLDYNLDNGRVYLTDLGAPFSKSRKLTLRDLGRHMSERMLDAMSQERVNTFDILQLGSPNLSSDNILTNIMKNVTARSKNKSKNKNNYNWDDYDNNGTDSSIKDVFESNMNQRFGNYISEIGNYVDYAKNSHGLRMGEANVLNPPFQFNEIDDVRSDFRRPQIGRLYSEEIYDYNMPIVYFQPGTVKVNTAGIKLASGFINQQSARYQEYLRGEGGPMKWLASKTSAVAKTVLSFGSKMVLDTATWYKWTPEFNKYIKFVNEMVAELAMWMGLVSFGNDSNAFNTDFADFDKTLKYDSAKDAFGDKGNSENPLARDSTGDLNYDKTADGTMVETRNGYLGALDDECDFKGILSALRMLPQFRHKLSSHSGKSYQEPDVDERNKTSGWDFADLTIPVAVDKGATSSESFSNSTMAHPVKDQYNNQFNEANQTRLTSIIGDPVADINMSDPTAVVDNVKGSLMSTASNAVKQGLSEIGLSSEAGMVASGLGRFILPDVWSDSTYDKSYSISMKLRTPYGHRLSIYENEYVPISFFTCLAAPRKIGIQSYTNPFYVKVFCKGLFSVPMGMITSFSINRGEDSNDRTVEGFFRTTSISMSIKDMLPDVAAGLDGGINSVSKAGNMGMNNFIANLAGIDFIERANLQNIFSHKLKNLYNTLRSYDVFGFGEGNDGSVGRTNLMIKVVGGGPLGKVISDTTKTFGVAANPFKTTPPSSYY